MLAPQKLWWAELNHFSLNEEFGNWFTFENRGRSHPYCYSRDKVFRMTSALLPVDDFFPLFIADQDTFFTM